MTTIPAARSHGTGGGPGSRRPRTWARVRFLASWSGALALVGFVVPRAVDVSWHGVLPALRSVHWPAAIALVGLWLLGLYVHSFVLTAAAPDLTHRRALTLNMTGSAVANVVPLGGAAGVELNRRMMKAWGIDARTFTGYTLLTNLWDIGSKLLLPVLGVLVLARAEQTVIPQLRTASLVAGVAFLVLVVSSAVLLASPRAAVRSGDGIERMLRRFLGMVGRDHELNLSRALLDVRQQCVGLVSRGWVRMSAGIVGYVALQALLLGFCLHLTTGGGIPWPEVLAAFAIERLLTVVPITPGGVGVADLGLVGVLVAFGADPAGVTAAAVLYRAFIFAIEIPVGGGVLGLWFLRQRQSLRRRPLPARVSTGTRRIAHVTDVFLPRLGGIETHVDELVRQQRAAGLEAEVLTPTAGSPDDPGWVRRLPAARARRAVTDYDVVHVHISMWSPYGVGAARAAMSAGIPTLVTVHSMWAGAGGVLRLAALASLRRWPVAWSAVSAAAASTFRRSLGGTEVAVLPNAVDVSCWRAGAASPAYAAEGTGPVRIVSVMRLAARKRPLRLLEMFAQLRDTLPGTELELVVVGDGPLRARMERHVQRHGLAGQVRMTGRIPRSEVREELRAASVYVAPAPKESFGIAALEARCVGLPVVAHRRSGVAEFIRDRVDGILVADDVEMICAVADLATDDALRERITAHNRRVPPRYDWSDVLERTDGLYRRAVACADTTSPEKVSARAPVAAGA